MKQGLLTAIAYVDLNPIRAGIANTPETSAFTSIEQRIREISAQRPITRNGTQNTENSASPPLLKFADEPTQPPAIPFSSREYLALVDWSGRAVCEDKRGSIDHHLPSIAQRMSIDADAWQRAMRPKVTCSVERWAGWIS